MRNYRKTGVVKVDNRLIATKKNQNVVFSHCPDGVARRKDFEVLLEEKDGNKLTLNVSEQLSFLDQRLFLVICGQIGKQETSVSEYTDRTNKAALKVLESMELTWDTFRGFIGTCELTRYELLAELGWEDSAENYKILEKMLKRLAKCTISMSGKEVATMPFMSYRSSGNKTNFRFALNRYASEPILGQKTQFSLIDTSNVFKLKELSGGIFAMFSSMIREGDSLEWNIDKLAIRVFGNESTNDSTNRKRRFVLKAALEEINDIEGWKVTFRGRGSDLIVIVDRSKTKGSLLKSKND